MRDIALTLVIFALLPLVAFGRPQLGVLLFVWISYMNPHRLTYGFAYNFPFAMIAAIVTIVGWLLSSEPKRLPWTTTTALLATFTLWISLTTAVALFPELAFDKWDRTVKIMLGAFLTLGIMRGRERIQALAWVTAGSLAFYGVKGGLFAISTGGSTRDLGPPDSFIADNNSAALAMLMVMPLLLYLQMRTEWRLLRLALLGAMFLTLMAILATYSRGAVVGLAGAGIFLWLKSRRKLLIAMIMGAAVYGSLTLMPAAWFDRVNTISEYQEDRSTLGRFDAWRHAVTVAVERPLTGGGFGTFSPPGFARYSPDVEWRAAHSIYFEVLGEQGFIGLFIFLAIGLVTFRNGTWILQKARNHEDLKWAMDLARMLQVSLVAYAVGGAFLSLGYLDLYYGLVVMMALTRLEVAKVLAEPRRAGDKASVDVLSDVALSVPREGLPRH